MHWLDTLQQLRPSRRLIPQDGMPLTVDTWNAAHDYHRQLLQAALLATRGWGIIAGLTLTLDNKDSRRIHVSPGVAIDPNGELLVAEGSSVYIPNQPGLVRITLQATAANRDEYYRAELCRLSVETDDPTPGALELARVDLSTANAPLKWPTNPEAPAQDELDQRWRLCIGAKAPLTLALVKLAPTVHDDHLLGWRALAREVAYTTARPIRVDEWSESTLSTSLEQWQAYAMICLVGSDNFVQDWSTLAKLEEYVKNGGILFYESCRQQPARSNLGSAADQQFAEWQNRLNLVETIGGDDLFASNHALGRLPYLFRQPPRGYADPAPRDFRISRGLGKGLMLYSNLDYGCAFAGTLENTPAPATRQQVREILEWGHNLIALAENYTS